MPWQSFKNVAACSQSHPWAVMKLDKPGGNPVGSPLGCHPDKATADKQVAALYANTNEGQ